MNWPGGLFHKGNRKKASFVYLLFLSFILITLIATLTMGILCYQLFDQYNEKQALEYNSKLLGQYTESVNSLVLNTAEDILRKVTNDMGTEYNLYRYMTEPLAGNIVDTQAVHQYLFRIASLTPMVFSIGIYYPQNELLISSDYIRYPLYSSEEEHPEIVHFSQLVHDAQEKIILENNYALIPDKLENFNYTKFSIDRPLDEISEHVVHIVRVLPAGENKMGAGIILSISGDVFASSLEGYHNSEDGNLFIFDREGNIIFHNEEEKIGQNALEFPYVQKMIAGGQKSGYFTSEIGTGTYVISYSYQQESQWYYVSATPINSFRATGKYVLQMVLAVSAASILLSLLLAAAMTHKISSPVKNLVRSLKSPGAPHWEMKIEEFDQIDSSISSMKSRIAEHEKQFLDMLPVYRMHFVSQLLSGEAVTLEEAAEKMELMDLNFPHPYFCALLIEQARSGAELAVEENALKDILIQEQTGSVLEQEGVLCLNGRKDQAISAILNFDGGEAELERIGEQLAAGFARGSGAYPYLAFGTVETDIFRLHHSCNKAEKRLRRRFLMPEQHTYYAWRGAAECDFPADKTCLHGFENALGSFDLENCVANLDALIERLRSGNYTMSSVFSILESYTKALDQFINTSLHEDNHYSAGIFTETEHIFELRLWLIELIKNAFAEINTPGRAGKNQLVAQTKELIRDNIQNRQLSLEWIADELGIGYKYLSRVFKDETGIRFVDYLSNCRLSHCRDLLLTTELKVEEIAEMMGYSTPQYFISRFKLMFGCTPKQYRIARDMPGAVK